MVRYCSRVFKRMISHHFLSIIMDLACPLLLQQKVQLVMETGLDSQIVVIIVLLKDSMVDLVSMDNLSVSRKHLILQMNQGNLLNTVQFLSNSIISKQRIMKSYQMEMMRNLLLKQMESKSKVLFREVLKWVVVDQIKERIMVGLLPIQLQQIPLILSH